LCVRSLVAWDKNQRLSFAANPYGQLFLPQVRRTWFLSPTTAVTTYDAIPTVVAEEDEEEPIEESFVSTLYDAASVAAAYDAISAFYSEEQDEDVDDEFFFRRCSLPHQTAFRVQRSARSLTKKTTPIIGRSGISRTTLTHRFFLPQTAERATKKTTLRHSPRSSTTHHLRHSMYRSCQTVLARR